MQNSYSKNCIPGGKAVLHPQIYQEQAVLRRRRRAVLRAVCGAFCISILSCGIAGALLTDRHSHTITLLPDGNLLTVGGVGEDGISTKTVEIFISAAARRDTRAPMGTARFSHTATLLPDGRVLVTGGIDDSGPGVPLNSAEVYDPEDNTWTPTGVMNSARWRHTTTLLKTGKVLVCGGNDTASSTGTVTNSCDLFTPGPDSFVATTPLGWGRAGHSAALIRTGHVFVAGGYNYDTHLSTYIVTTEVYDPVTEAWTPGPTLIQARAFHTATALNTGNVLITGGYHEKNLRENLGYLESAEIYDVAVNAMVPAAAIPTSDAKSRMRITNHTATLTPQGDVSIRGGLGNITTSYFDNADIGDFDEGSRLKSSTISMNTGDIDPDSTLYFPMDIELSVPVSGIVVDGYVLLSPPPETDPETPSAVLEDANIFLGPSTASINGFYIDSGRLCGDNSKPLCNPSFQLMNPDGIIVFNPWDEYPRTGGTRETASEEFTATGGLLNTSPATIDPEATASILDTSWLSGTIVVPFPESALGGTISIGSATIKEGTITGDDWFEIKLDGGIADISGANNFVETPEGIMLIQAVTFEDLTGEVTNSTESQLSPPSPSGLTINLTLILEYVTDNVHMKNAVYNIHISTVVIRKMIFADDMRYNPSENSWSFGTPGMAVFNHTTLLSPNADNLHSGGLTCPLEGSPGPGTGLYNCDSFVLVGGDQVTIFQWKDEIPWNEGPSLNGPRGHHTSTLLPDGRILTAGGTNNKSETLNSAEIYNPVDEEWVFTSSMTVPRSKHTATLLPNGTILVIGGKTVGVGATATVEIYYPDSKNWVATASMTYARQAHTATLLPDGNVLVTGGSSSQGYLSSCEIYNSTMAVWTVADSFTLTSRAQHTATLLHNGQVLVTGGVKHEDGALSSWEIYDPETNSWTNNGDMNTKRFLHTATLLRDGRVIVVGGEGPLGAPIDESFRTEIFDGADWRYVSYTNSPSIEDVPGTTWWGNDMAVSRFKHTTTLLPNGKLLIIGGVTATDLTLDTVEGFDVDFSTWQPQGKMNSARGYHTTVLQANGNLLAIGGYDGANYISGTEYLYFMTGPDLYGKEPKERQPSDVSASPNIFDRGDSVTMLGKTPNFHGITEASGGGGGTTNSSFYHPRVYLQSIDNPSGYMVDITSSVYYNGLNTWDKMASSITFIAPPKIPYGWYHLRVAANAQFSDGCTVQISIPRPTGVPADLAGTVMSSTTIVWTWNSGIPVGSIYDGYAIFSLKDNVFITTVPSDAVSFTQTNLAPNTAASIKLGEYNMGGYGEFIPSATYYTYAAIPKTLRVTSASFVSATLVWDANGNTGYTIYELSMSKSSDFSYDNFIPLPFSVRYTTASYTIDYLTPNQYYYFRVRAQNGDGISTEYDMRGPALGEPYVSTITVGQVSNLTGTAINTTQINWSWDSVSGANWYGIYEILDDDSVVWITSVTGNSFPQTGLSINTIYSVAVKAVNDLGGGQMVKGPLIESGDVATLAAVPLAAPFSNIGTESMIAHWISNGNPSDTQYAGALSPSVDFVDSGDISLFETTATSYTFTGLIPNTQYYGRIYAVNKDGKQSPAPPTEPVSLGSGYTLAQAPIELHCTMPDISKIVCEWNPQNNPSQTAYRLIQSTDNFNVSFSTPISFADNTKITGVETEELDLLTTNITGLLTSTTYYFKVMARHDRDLTRTGATPAVPPVFTLPGPAGAPAGSIVGLTDPSRDVTIHGTLPDSREVWITVPASSFDSQVQIAVSRLDTDPCQVSSLGRTTFGIYSTGNAQPKQPIEFRFTYFQNESPAINSRAPRVVFARHVPASNSCLPLRTTVNKGLREITASLNHFSSFQLMELVPRSNLDNIEIYPNPFYPNRNNGFVTLKNLTGSAEVRIYTLSGEKMWEGTANGSGTAYWYGKNSYGQSVASGIYLGVIDSGSKKKIVKIAVER